MTKAKIEKIRQLRRSGHSITSICQLLFPNRYSMHKSGTRKLVYRYSKNIYSIAAWKHAFR
jgi:hypothetical protein